MMKHINKYAVLLLVLALVGISACNVQKSHQNESKCIDVIYTDWSESVAITYLAKVLLEDEMDYDVVLKMAGVDSVYAALANDRADVFADAWLPRTHQNYLSQYRGAIDQVGIVYPGARIGFLVPEYSALHSIADIAELSDLNIVGIESEAGVMLRAAKAVEDYHISSVQLESSTERSMLSIFAEAYRRRQEVIITGWEPHWLFARYEVRFLDDPKGVFEGRENIVTLSSKDFSQTHPRAYRFFERMQLSEVQFNELIYYTHQFEDPELGVRQWIKKNEYVVNQWVKGLKPQREKIM